MQEDKTLRFVNNEETHEQVIYASFMSEHQLCLEEYVDLLHSYTLSHPLYTENHTIFFHPYDAELTVDERRGYDVSGNNVDGLIITVSSIL